MTKITTLLNEYVNARVAMAKAPQFSPASRHADITAGAKLRLLMNEIESLENAYESVGFQANPGTGWREITKDDAEHTAVDVREIYAKKRVP